MKEPIKYRYKGKWLTIISVYILFGLCAYLFYTKAVNNEVGLIINGIIELNTFQATIFYWILFTFSSVFVFIALFLTYSNLTTEVYLVLHKNKVVIPPYGLFKKTFTEVLFDDITEIREQTVSSNTFLTIHYLNTKTSIMKSMLASKKDYEFIKEFIINNTK